MTYSSRLPRLARNLSLTLRTILDHPLNALNRGGALVRYAKWQIGSRLVPGAVLVPFINETFLVVSPGMTGATQNIYTGLSDFADCSLLLHLLRGNHLFVDIGANVGVYTVLAAGVVGAQTMSIEPVPGTFSKLCANIRINNIADKVAAHNIGLGRQEAMLRFTADQDTKNHIIEDENWTGSCIQVPISTLDTILKDKTPTLIKIDVEGWESEVLAGAALALRSTSLLGLIVEMNSSDPAFNVRELAVHECLLDNNFKPYAYSPLTRSVTLLPSKNLTSNNTIYLRDVDQVSDLLASAPAFQVAGRSI
jgi:FkbM family methyltransferase